MTEAVKGSIAIGWCHGVYVGAGFANSLASLLAYELSRPAVRLRQFIPQYSGVNVSNGRNQVVRAFLAGDCEWLWMLDTDMTFPRNVLDPLMDAADPDRYPVLGALAFGVNEDVLFPTLYGIASNPDTGKPETIRFDSYPRNALFPVVMTGAACLLVHREALMKVSQLDESAAFPWFQERELNGQSCGEDMTFCIRLARAGVPVHVHTGVTVGHQKTYLLTEKLYTAQREAIGMHAAIDPPDEDDQAEEGDAA